MEDLKNTLEESYRYYIGQERQIVSRLALLPKGAIKAKRIGSENYFYLTFRKGGKVTDQYLGKTVPESTTRGLAERKRLLNELKDVRKALRLLHKQAGTTTDFTTTITDILAAFTKEGLWESGLEIIGSWCFLLYQKYLPIETYPLRTQDIDILVPLPYRGRKHDLPFILKQLGFVENFNPDGSTYFTGSGLKVELISPKKGRKDASATYFENLKVSTQLLRYTDLLMQSGKALSIAQGVRALLPSPSAFMLHKLVIATLWQRAAKREKDLRQAISIARYVLQDPEERRLLEEAWAAIPQGWRKKVAASLQAARQQIPLETNLIDQLKTTLI
jgi:hypothetical protein